MVRASPWTIFSVPEGRKVVRASPWALFSAPERTRTVSATVQGGGSALSVRLAATSVAVDTTIVPVNKNAALCAISGLSERRGPVEY